jgi:UDPglucose 6-dehydrogenase
VAGLYRRLGRPMVTTDVRTAEMAKHASNTFLAASISFVNEIANLCEETGADAQMVAAILKQDKRIGPHAFLSPGLGYAGGTLGRDVRALQDIGKQVEVATPLLDAVSTVNADRAERVVRRIASAVGDLGGRRVAIFGLTYKPGTSTMRRAISLDIIRRLTEEGALVRAFDPLADLAGSTDLPPFERCDTPYRAAKDADAAVLLTEWDRIEELSFTTLARNMRGRVLVDTRNLFDRGRLTRAGFACLSIGRAETRTRT